MSPLSGYIPLLQFWHFNKGIYLSLSNPDFFCGWFEFKMTKWWRVFNRFFGIRDFPYLNLGILKQNPGEIRDWKYRWRCMRQMLQMMSKFLFVIWWWPFHERFWSYLEGFQKPPGFLAKKKAQYEKLLLFKSTGLLLHEIIYHALSDISNWLFLCLKNDLHVFRFHFTKDLLPHFCDKNSRVNQQLLSL